MFRLIASHAAVVFIAVAIAASWHNLRLLWQAGDVDPVGLALLLVAGGLYFAICQAAAALRETRLAALYPTGGVRSQAGKCDPLSEPTN